MESPPRHPNAFPKAARLRTSAEFARVQKQGRSVDLGTIVFRVSKRADGRGRLGLAVSRKVGNSPERNRIKRKLRECFRLRQAAFAGFDLVAIGRAGAADLSTSDVARMFEDLAKRIR